MMTISLGNTTRARIIDGVIGQLSDGKWEDSPAMNKYWQYCHTEGTDLIIDNDKWDSGFRGRAEAWIKHWFAGKLKAVVQDEVGNNKQGWSRDNMEISEYISYNHDMTVSHCYECYDYLLERTGHKYAFQKLANAPGMKEFKSAISKVIIDESLSLNIDTDVNEYNDWVESILVYYEDEFEYISEHGINEAYLNTLKSNFNDEKYELAWPNYTAASKMLQSVFYDNSDYLKEVTQKVGLSMAADDCFKAVYFITIRPKMIQVIYNHFNSN